ncbi:putative UDP-glycosyltransferase [Polypedilum vanderplanki]|uniref:UDP-glucuronosyltransferase n=1 Tax=Polypedilum vanderplanki TaxID=319348 RepID=A0A9J6C1Y7_POLVA|nr:putative UDP-glycosyltransferase [Polypedilum vanderplanki]
MQCKLFVVIALAACLSFTTSSKILFLVAFPGKSHWLMFEPVINELLNRGHEVTAITHYPLKTDSKNYHEILINPSWIWEDRVNMTSYFTRSVIKESVIFKITSLWDFGIVTTNFTLNSPPIKKFIEDDNQKFDLVISEQFQQEAMNMFAYKYNCPIVAIGTLDYADYMHHAKGQITPWSYVPHFLSYSTDQMTLIERLENFFVSLYDAIGRKFYYLPKMTNMAREAFKKLENQQGRLPSVENLEKKIAVHLMNSHPALSYPRPKMPGMIDIAGIHIKEQKPLPKDIQKFMDDANDGVILISFGTFLQSSKMPPAQYKAMLDAFSKLKQRIIWKWEEDNKNVKFPSNVMVRKWLPQADILAHKNCKLMIGHGGIFGTQEAIYYGKPMIVFPFYGDQHLNGYKLERDGIGILQAINELTSDSLLAAINRILNDATFYENVKRKSEIFRANQNPPLETAIFWIEYVLNFNGAEHLQSHGKNLSWIRILSIDIMLLIFGGIYLIYDLIKMIAGRKIKDDTNKTDKKKKNKKKEN